MAERVDVCIVGSGFGGSIAAWRLAELYTAAGEDPAGSSCSSAAGATSTPSSASRWTSSTSSDVYSLIQSTERKRRPGGHGERGRWRLEPLPGGVAARPAPRRSSAATAIPTTAPTAACGPQRSRGARSNNWYLRAERALRVRQPCWNEVSKSGGLWAATLDAAGHTCDRVPLAIDFGRCVDAKWCHTGCVFGAKNTVTTNYLASAERAGVRVRPKRQVGAACAARRRTPPATATWSAAGSEEIECKVLILAAGAMGTPPILMRSRGSLPSLSPQVGLHVGVNGDHVGALEYDPAKVRSLLKLPGYGQFHKGKPITTMTYDFFARRRAHRFDGTRFTLQEIFLSTLTNFLYDDGRGGGYFWRPAKKRSVSEWSNRIELLAMVEDTMDGRFTFNAPQRGGIRPNAGPVVIGAFHYQFSEQSLRVRELADRAMRQIGERRGLAKFLQPRGDAGRVRGASARRGADGGLGGARSGERPLRGLRQRGSVLHGLVGDPDLARREPVAHDRRGLRARGRPPDQAGPRARAAGAACRFQTQGSAGHRGESCGLAPRARAAPANSPWAQ